MAEIVMAYSAAHAPMQAADPDPPRPNRVSGGSGR